MPDPDPRGPERDRRLAAQPRLGPRYRQPVGELVDRWMRGPEARRLKRHRHTLAALGSVLDEAELAKVSIVSVMKGTLTLAVADNLLLAELRNLRHGELVAALVAAGTGIGRVRYRLQRSR